MTCSSCGALRRPGAKFCAECGARLDWSCPACGAAASPDQKFCAECGARLPGAMPTTPARAPAAERFAAPSGYTPPHLAARILKDRAALQGERKQVTVLFADELAPYIRFALSVDPGDPAVLRMDPAERVSRLLRGMRQPVQLRSLAKPTVMVIEDLHWIDSSSEAYLKTIIDDLTGAPTLLILTWRPTYRAPFNEHTYVSRLVLEPLVDEDALALVRATLGIDNLPDELARLIAHKAEGNPFFLEEIGRALVETGAVRAEAGRLLLTLPATALAVPDRVQDVIAARIDRLSENQKRTVQTASVIGREFTLRLLRRVAEAAAHTEQALAELKALEFVYERAAAETLTRLG